MNGDIIKRGKNDEAVYVEYGGKYHRINLKSAGDSISARQKQFALDGTYGELVKTVTNAMQQNGFEVRVAWSGIINALGDFGSVYPPCVAKTIDQINEMWNK
jgi:hypothetical protein